MTGRPEPLARAIEGQLMDFIDWHRRAMEDGKIDGDEALTGVALAVGMIPDVSDMVVSVCHVATVLTGAHGIFGSKAERGWTEAHRSRNNLVMFPVRSDNESQQSGD